MPKGAGTVPRMFVLRYLSTNGNVLAETMINAPVLMTGAATIAGHFPLTLVTGAGAAARNSIGLVLVGGMFIGTLSTLFVVPSIYMLIARDHHKDSGETGSQDK
jgi:Cu/Ag efflux pump CusA